MKGFITACFLVTNTLGNSLNLLWTPKYGGSLTNDVAMDERGLIYFTDKACGLDVIEFKG